MQILEHVHVNVRDLAATERLLRVAVPEFMRRGGGKDSPYGPWLHIGTADCYIALTEMRGAQPMRETDARPQTYWHRGG